MNVLFVSNDPRVFDETSAARVRMRAYAAEIGTLHILSRAGASVHAEYGEGKQEGSLFLYSVAASKYRAPFALAKRAHSLILEKGIEVVSAQDPFEHGWAALRAVRGTSAKLQVQLHTDFLSPWFVKRSAFRAAKVPAPLLNRVRRILADKVLPRADGIRVVSERLKESLIHRYGVRIQTPSVIPVPVSVTMPALSQLPPHKFPFAFITASRLEPEKRIQDILYALARIHLQYPAAGLVIVGTGSESARLHAHVTKLGLADRVVFIEEWRHDVLGLMQSAQCYIQASAYEGYGLTLIEAALARVPIITTDVGIVGEVFMGYRDVLSVPPGDPAALAVAMVGIIEDVQARQSLIMNAERAAKAHLEQFTNVPTLIARDLLRLTGSSK